MVLTADCIAAITHIVASAMAAVLVQLRSPRATAGSSRRALDERHYRKIHVFSGVGWKDFSFQFKAATRSSHEAAFELLCWAELEQNGIDLENYTELHGDSTKRVSGELFNIFTTSLEGEPLQMLYNCNFNGPEAWRLLSKRYSPTTPLRAMQAMLQNISPEKTKDFKQVHTHVDRWESKILALSRDFDEQLSERMKAAILILAIPSELRDAILQSLWSTSRPRRESPRWWR